MQREIKSKMEVFILDIEWRDNKKDSQILELAVVSEQTGEVLFNEVFQQEDGIDVSSYKINNLGFCQETINNARPLSYYKPMLIAIMKGGLIATYGKRDLDSLPWLKPYILYSDICQRFSDRYGSYSIYHGDHTWVSLRDACSIVGYEPNGIQHRALTDALSAREVWRYLDNNTNTNSLINDYVGFDNVVRFPKKIGQQL